MLGKDVRLSRVFSGEGRALIVPVDHAVTLGPVPGLADAAALVAALQAARPDAVLAHRGIFQRRLLAGGVGLVLHLSAGTALGGEPHLKTLVCDVEDAVRLGADAVSVHVTLGTAHEREALAELSAVSAACLRWGMPLVAMTYPHGTPDPKAVAHAARIAAELGADAVKAPFTGSGETFARVVEGCFVPVLVAGGERVGDTLLEMVDVAMQCGAAGACVGRGVFQAPDVQDMVMQLRALVHGTPGVVRAVAEGWAG